jgi:phage gp36-like protein
MGAYIDSQDFIDRCGTREVNELAKASGVDKARIIASMIARAESMVNAYVGKSYQLPLPASALIQDWCLAISEYELWKRGMAPDVPPKYKQSYQDALLQMIDMRDGKMIPPPDENGVEAVLKGTVGSSIDIESDEALFSATAFGVGSESEDEDTGL